MIKSRPGFTQNVDGIYQPCVECGSSHANKTSTGQTLYRCWICRDAVCPKHQQEHLWTHWRIRTLGEQARKQDWSEEYPE